MASEGAVKQLVALWLQQRYGRTPGEVLDVIGSGSDWAGSTGVGFHSEFSVNVRWRDEHGQVRSEMVEGNAMESLWLFVIDPANWQRAETIDPPSG